MWRSSDVKKKITVKQYVQKVLFRMSHLVTFSLIETKCDLFKVPYNNLHLSKLQEQLWRVYSKFDDVYGEKLRSNLFCKYICFLSHDTMETDVFLHTGEVLSLF